jgi:toxin FitB
LYLLDTDVVSELRRIKPHGAVLEWLGSVDDADLHISAVTLAEVQAGVELTRDQDAAKAAELQAWVDLVAQTYSVLPMDGATFLLWATMVHRKSDKLNEDAMIAATARIHRLTVVTRNTGDFAGFSVPLLNPFNARQRGV